MHSMPGWHAQRCAVRLYGVRCLRGQLRPGPLFSMLRFQAGRFGSAVGLVACNLCTQGQFMNRTGAQACVACPLGTFASQSSGSVNCTQCAPVRECARCWLTTSDDGREHFRRKLAPTAARLAMCASTFWLVSCAIAFRPAPLCLRSVRPAALFANL